MARVKAPVDRSMWPDEPAELREYPPGITGIELSFQRFTAALQTAAPWEDVLAWMNGRVE